MFVTLALVLAVVSVPSLSRWRFRRRPDPDEQQFYLAIHAELRAGASLRQAIANAAQDHDGPLMRDIYRAAASEQPMGVLIAAIRRLPHQGGAASLATQVATESGGRAADVFLRLADRARTDAELRLRRRTLTTQARLSAVIVGSLPLLWLAFGGVGRLQMLVHQGGATVAAVGVALEALGILLVWRLAVT